MGHCPCVLFLEHPTLAAPHRPLACLVWRREPHELGLGDPHLPRVRQRRVDVSHQLGDQPTGGRSCQLRLSNPPAPPPAPVAARTVDALAQVDVGDTLVASDDQRVLVVTVGGGVAEGCRRRACFMSPPASCLVVAARAGSARARLGSVYAHCERTFLGPAQHLGGNACTVVQARRSTAGAAHSTCRAEEQPVTPRAPRRTSTDVGRRWQTVR